MKAGLEAYESIAQIHDAIRSSEPNVLVAVSKTSNRNILVYYTCRDSEGRIDRVNPVRAEWIMFQDDPSGQTREPLSFIEHKAFGIMPRPYNGAPCFSIPALYGGSGIIYVHEDADGNAHCLVQFTHADKSVTRMRVTSAHVHVVKMQIDWTGVDTQTDEPVVVRLTNMGMSSSILRLN
jgi:hypothetical protein